jgi:hypothetical protein
MSITSSFDPFDIENVFYDLDTWKSMFEDAARGNSALADSFAMLLYKIVRELSAGPQGVERTINTLKLGIEFLFQYSDTRDVSFKLFLYYLECVLVPSDFPRDLIGPAIERAEATAMRLYAEDAKAAPEKRKPEKRRKQRKN